MTTISFNLGWFLLFLEDIRYFIEKEQSGKEKNVNNETFYSKNYVVIIDNFLIEETFHGSFRVYFTYLGGHDI